MALKPTCIRFEDELFEQLKAAAAERGVSMASLVGEACRAYLGPAHREDLLLKALERYDRRQQHSQAQLRLLLEGLGVLTHWIFTNLPEHPDPDGGRRRGASLFGRFVTLVAANAHSAAGLLPRLEDRLVQADDFPNLAGASAGQAAPTPSKAAAVPPPLPKVSPPPVPEL